MTAPMPDGHVTVAHIVRELHDAIHALVSERLTTSRLDGRIHVTRLPSVYDEMRDNIAGQQGTQNGSVARSMPPLWVDAADWIHRVDEQTRDWITATSTTSTPERWLAQLPLHWRPQDTPQLDKWTVQLDKWVQQAEQLLHPTTRPVRAPCPACGRRWHYRRDTGGEIVRTDSLQLTDQLGCTCQGCHATWTPDQYSFLGRLIGCAVPAGVTE